MTTKWNYRAEMINACNCDWGCPCNFNAKPTNGSCEGTWGIHITSGICGDTKLDGLNLPGVLDGLVLCMKAEPQPNYS